MRELVSGSLKDKVTADRNICLSAGCSQTRVRVEALEKVFKVVWREFEVAVEFTDIIEVVELELGQARVERLDDPGADPSLRARLAMEYPNPRMPSGRVVGDVSGVVMVMPQPPSHYLPQPCPAG